MLLIHLQVSRAAAGALCVLTANQMYWHQTVCHFPESWGLICRCAATTHGNPAKATATNQARRRRPHLSWLDYFTLSVICEFNHSYNTWRFIPLRVSYDKNIYFTLRVASIKFAGKKSQRNRSKIHLFCHQHVISVRKNIEKKNPEWTKYAICSAQRAWWIVAQRFCVSGGAQGAQDRSSDR